MKIYTRTGDSGETGLFGGGRVGKDHPRVDACGAVDELNAFIGQALLAVAGHRARAQLERIQHDLFALGSHLATPPEAQRQAGLQLPSLPESRPEEMENWIDEADTQLVPLTGFILPSGSAGACALHVCRTVCRRAERSMVALAGEDPRAAFVLRYLNRLSDLLFVLARLENHDAGIQDTQWRQEPR